MRKKRAPYLGISWITLLLSIGCSNHDSNKPNFLILISDDQRWDQLSYADQPIIPELKTPHMDQLAREGVYFRNAFIPTPICAVSRACIMTGRYASSHGMNHFNTPIAEEVLQLTYPALLHENGYRTGVLGKWGMGVEGTEKIFDVFEAWQNQGAYFHQTDSGLIHNSEWLAVKAREFLAATDANVPFCLTVCYKAPHHPYQPDPRDRNLFEELIIPKRTTDTPEGYQAMSQQVMDSSLNRWCYFDERKDEATKNDFERNFLRCVMSLDRSVGEIMQSLQDLKLDKNTVTIFLSDNGYMWGEHGLGGKWLLYEESIRTPIMIQVPGLSSARRGSKMDQLVLNIDIAPTILDLAGIPAPAEMDGMSLLPLLKGENVSWRKDFWMEHVAVIEVEGTPIPDSRGLRTENWKYIRYLNAVPEVEEMYDLQSDPSESINRINDPAFEEVRTQLRRDYENYLNRWKN